MRTLMNDMRSIHSLALVKGKVISLRCSTLFKCDPWPHAIPFHQVQLVRMFALQQPGNPDSKPDRGVSRDYVVDVTMRVPEGRHLEGARAIGSFGLALQPLVVLIPASVPVKL